MVLTVHHLRSSQSFRVLEELSNHLPYALQVYDRTDQQLAPDAYKALSPLGTSPTITDDNPPFSTASSTQPYALSESNAILDYIVDKVQRNGRDKPDALRMAQQLRPGLDSPCRTDYLFWFHASPCSMQFVMSTDSLFRGTIQRVPWPVNAIVRMVAGKVHEQVLDPRLHAILRLAQEQLSQHDYLAGGDHLTLADITSIYSFEAAFDRYGNDGYNSLSQQYPACMAWLERMHQRPAFQRALQAIGEDHVSFKW